jgi:hypothetical protein
MKFQPYYDRAKRSLVNTLNNGSFTFVARMLAAKGATSSFGPPSATIKKGPDAAVIFALFIEQELFLDNYPLTQEEKDEIYQYAKDNAPTFSPNGSKEAFSNNQKEKKQ